MELNCPVPKSNYDKVIIAHGGGGRLSNDLIENLFKKELGNIYLNELHDGAIMKMNGRIAFSTDSFVVNPIFFPGGDIGKLAVYGTVNDIACCGAVPEYLSLGLILEEGFEISDLCRIIRSVRIAAEAAGVKIVTGDTKVVEKGKGDKIFINTSGIGTVIDGVNISPARCEPGDIIIINGFIADHGIAIMSSREGLDFQTSIVSDCAPLSGLTQDILNITSSVKVFRDPTRGGLASALNEISTSSGFGITINEDAIPVREEVRGACEILGFDPLYVANEGKIITIIPPEFASDVLSAMQDNPFAKDSAIIGEITTNKPGLTLNTVIGSQRLVDMISGEQLPRIC